MAIPDVSGLHLWFIILLMVLGRLLRGWVSPIRQQMNWTTLSTRSYLGALRLRPRDLSLVVNTSNYNSGTLFHVFEPFMAIPSLHMKWYLPQSGITPMRKRLTTSLMKCTQGTGGGPYRWVTKIVKLSKYSQVALEITWIKAIRCDSCPAHYFFWQNSLDSLLQENGISTLPDHWKYTQGDIVERTAFVHVQPCLPVCARVLFCSLRLHSCIPFSSGSAHLAALPLSLDS